MGDTPDFQYGKGNLDHVSQVVVKTPGKNKKGEKLNNLADIGVLARQGDFPEDKIMDSKNIIHYVLSLPTHNINQDIDAEFRDAYTQKQHALNNLLYSYGTELNTIREKSARGKEPITAEEKRLLDKANKAESELSYTYLKIHDKINDSVQERRQHLIENISLYDLSDIITAVKIYIGHFYFKKMVDIWDLLTYDIAKADKDELGRPLSTEEQLSFIENNMKEIKATRFDGRTLKAELLNGKKYDRRSLDIGATGGIAPFMDFIKKHDANAHSELTEFIKWAMKTATRQLRFTPKKNIELYHSAVQEANGEPNKKDSEEYP